MNIIMRCRFGSHLYGMNTPESDLDYKTVYMPTLRELLLNTYKPIISISPKGANKPGDIDEEYIALPRFIRLACENRPHAIEMLHAEGDNLLQTSSIWEELVRDRRQFYSKSIDNLVTFAQAQAERYDLKGDTFLKLLELKHLLEKFDHKTRLLRLHEADTLPINALCRYETREEGGSNAGLFYMIGDRAFNCKVMIKDVMPSINAALKKYGERVKAMVNPENELLIDHQSVCYALRAAYQTIDILKYGDFSYPLSQTKTLMDIKLGKLNYDEIKELLHEVMEEIPKWKTLSTLPDEVNFEDWEDRLLGYYLNAHRELDGRV